MLFPFCSVNHRLPSGPDAMFVGALLAVGIGYSVKTPAVVSLVTILRPFSTNHRLPSGPVVIPYARGAGPAGIGNSVIAPARVMRPILLVGPYSVNQRAPSGPSVMPNGFEPAESAYSVTGGGVGVIDGGGVGVIDGGGVGVIDGGGVGVVPGVGVGVGPVNSSHQYVCPTTVVNVVELPGNVTLVPLTLASTSTSSMPLAVPSKVSSSNGPLRPEGTCHTVIGKPLKVTGAEYVWLTQKIAVRKPAASDCGREPA